MEVILSTAFRSPMALRPIDFPKPFLFGTSTSTNGGKMVHNQRSLRHDFPHFNFRVPTSTSRWRMLQKPTAEKGSLRHDFPDFLFGASTSAFQIEGAVDKDGRGPSIWDTYAKEKGLQGWEDGSDHYHKYKEDVKALKDLGFDAYRFSISWSRILPNGRGAVNEKGIQFYNDLLDELKANGIKPFVTLYHWDLPQALETEYGGFLSPKIVKDFEDFANLCFERFGDRVKHWITICGPWSVSYSGYGVGSIAPGRGSSASEAEKFMELGAEEGQGPTVGDPGTEPYIVGKNLLLAHAAAVNLYRKKYKNKQNGEIGIVLQQIWPVPHSESEEDRKAVDRAIDFLLGWFMDPLATGNYPKSMRDLLGSRLPELTPEESKMIKGTYDFIALNYYTAKYARHAPELGAGKQHVATDRNLELLPQDSKGVLIGEPAGSNWIHVYPQGIMDFMLLMKNKYNNPVIYISENGTDEKEDISKLPIWEALSDHTRVSYYQKHLAFLKKAIQEHGVNVKGYFTWSLLDNFEWGAALSSRFGVMYVDYGNGFKRYPKLSALWFKFHLDKEKVY